MNERIKELMGQTLDEKFAGTWSVMDMQDLTKFADRFAELIVRECMKESMDEIVADEEIAQEKDPLIQEYLKGNNQGIVDAVVRFRNHFGVEE
jgi:ABC-type transporter Mla maintaining outer membrane lipid asymmetry ATPase subunit MlaF